MSSLRSLAFPLAFPLARPALAATYARGCGVLAHLRLHGRAAARRFDRVCIVAPLQRQNGIAAGAILQHRAMLALGIDAQLVDATESLRNPFHRAPHDAATAYVVHCGGPQTPNLLNAVVPHAARAWRIAYWAWELPTPPPGWQGFDRLVSEIWTPSGFAAASLSQLTTRPVHVVPHRVAPHPPRRRDWAAPFSVLAMADSRSSLARKNPLGALEAFLAAFGPSPEARLVLKLNGPVEAGPLERRAAGLPNVTLLRAHLDAPALAALYREADVLLSLHRAEGFGLPMLEAMAHGIPAVATGWSGNLEFMDAGNGILIPYHLVPVVDPAGIYAGSSWAEPDLAAAAAALRRLAVDRAHYEALAAAAHAAVAGAAIRLPFGLCADGRQKADPKDAIHPGPRLPAHPAARPMAPATEEIT